MGYRILANNLWVDTKGDTQIFLHIEVNNGLEIWGKAARLSPDDVARVVAVPSAIDDIAFEMESRALITRPQEKIEDEERKAIALAQIKLETAQEEVKAAQLKLDILTREAEIAANTPTE